MLVVDKAGSLLASAIKSDQIGTREIQISLTEDEIALRNQ
jgi:hypothetical protein